jgi:hypothetical protein
LDIHEGIPSSKRILRDMDCMDSKADTPRALIGYPKFNGWKEDNLEERSETR